VTADIEPADEYDDLRPSMWRWIATLLILVVMSWLLLFIVAVFVVAVASWVGWVVRGVLL
jgi:hypothetical protein